jgi:hypothetical protein
LHATTVTTIPNLSGPVTSSGNITDIGDGAITLNKIQQISTDAFLGRVSLNSGVVEVLTIPTARAALSIDQTNNTSDLNKPISTATNTALNTKLTATNNLSDVSNYATALSNIGGIGPATTNTVTNKSISGSTNTLSNIPNSALVNPSILINGVVIPLGGVVNTPLGTVTSFSKNDNFGIISTVTNPNTTPNHSIGIDSAVVSTRASVRIPVTAGSSNPVTITYSSYAATYGINPKASFYELVSAGVYRKREDVLPVFNVTGTTINTIQFDMGIVPNGYILLTH